MIEKFVQTVKRQIEYWQRQIEIYGPAHPRYRAAKIGAYQHLVREFSELLDYLQKQDGAAVQPDTRAIASSALSAPAAIAPTTLQPQPHGRENDLSDLPPELLKELSDSVKGEQDPLVEIIDARGGTANLDEILIDLYRKHKEIGKRALIANKLYRLSKRQLLWAVPGRKGVYTTKPDGAAHVADTPSGNEEGSDVPASEPSLSVTGAAGSPKGPSKPSPVGSTPTASTKRRRDFFATTAIPSVRVPR